MIDLSNKKVIVCGSKPYNSDKLDKIIDSYDFIIRNNFNLHKYGTRISDLQVLNNHVYNSRLQMSKLIADYGKDYKLNILEDFYKFAADKEKTMNIMNIPIDIIQKNISFKINKNLRCGFYSIAYLMNLNLRPHIAGFSLKQEEYENHILNNIKVNDAYHDREQEISILKELESKNLIKIIDK